MHDHFRGLGGGRTQQCFLSLQPTFSNHGPEPGIDRLLCYACAASYYDAATDAHTGTNSDPILRSRYYIVACGQFSWRDRDSYRRRFPAI